MTLATSNGSSARSRDQSATRCPTMSSRATHSAGPVRAGPGHWGAFEVKLNPQAVDEGAQSLLRFAAHVDASRQGEPSCLGVIPSTGVAGRREDGVHVIPIGTLGP